MTASRIAADQIRNLCWLDGIDMERWQRRAICAVDTAWMKAQQHD